MAQTPLSVRDVAALLCKFRYRFANEDQLQAAIANLLDREGVSYVREHSLSPANRVDFWLGGIVIEVKVDGTLAQALRQCQRYIQHPNVTGVVLASTQRWATEVLSKESAWADKPFEMTRLQRQYL